MYKNGKKYTPENQKKVKETYIEVETEMEKPIEEQKVRRPSPPPRMRMVVKQKTFLQRYGLLILFLILLLVVGYFIYHSYSKKNTSLGSLISQDTYTPSFGFYF